MPKASAVRSAGAGKVLTMRNASKLPVNLRAIEKAIMLKSAAAAASESRKMKVGGSIKHWA